MTDSPESLRARLTRYLIWNFGYDPPVWATLFDFRDFISEIELPVEPDVVAEAWESYQAVLKLQFREIKI